MKDARGWWFLMLGLLVFIGIYLANHGCTHAPMTALGMTVLVAIQVGVLVQGWSRGPWFRLPVALAPIPLGLVTWITGMACGFDGGGAWTYWVLQTGIWMLLAGILTTVCYLPSGMEWTRGRLLILAGTILLLGFLLLFGGFCLYFDRPEPWMKAMMTLGLLAIPAGVVVKVLGDRSC